MKRPFPGDLPFGAIISITGRCRFIFFNDRLRPLGLSAGQVPVLMLLYEEQNIMQETLVRHYQIDKGAIARAVKKLEEAGFIRRITDPDNRRAVRLFLTEKGEQVAPVIRAINREWEEQVCTGLSPAERESLTTFMRTVAENSHRSIQNTGEHPDAGN
ncbi:MAG: MarR family transcriptional regulator [Methanoregula sp.]|nr:MarR family transcriptional regulator [Methanoregula sp.]